MAKATAIPKVKLAADRGYDVGAPNQHAEIKETSDSEPFLVKHVATVAGHADMLHKNWQDRVAKEGTKAWINPLAPREQRIKHPTKKACQDEITKKYQMQVKQAKLTNQPKSKYTPQEIVVEPKRTLEDFMGPKAAAMTRAAEAVAGTVQNLGNLAHQLSGRQLTSGALMGMVESAAVGRVNELSDDELKACVNRATFGGKLKLAKAAKAACATRGVKVLI